METRLKVVDEVAEKLKKELQSFDPLDYKVNFITIKPHYHQIEVGKTAALIGRLVTFKATKLELTRAMRYFKVIMDSCKHNLDWKRAKLDFGVAELAKKYK